MPLLVHEGTQQISDSLQLASAELSQKVELLEKNVATASKKLAKKTAALEKFKKSRVLYEKNITNALKTSEAALKKHYELRVTQKIDERKEALITITMDKMPTLRALPFINKYERSKEYSAAVGEVFNRVLEEIRKEILDGFTRQEAFVAYKDAYEENRNKLLQEAEAFNELKGLASINPQFPVSFVNSVHGMRIPQAEKQPCEFGNLIWDILAFGLFLPFINSRARATAIVDKYLDNFKEMAFNELWDCMYQENPEGPMKALRNSLSDFKRCFNKAEEIVQKNLDGAKGLQKDAKHTSDEISSHTMSIPQTTGTANKVRLFIADETKKELRSLSKEYADMCSQHRNQRNDVVTNAIEYHLVSSISRPFVDKVKRANEFERALSTLPIFDIGAFKAKLSSYYKERKDTLQRLYQKEGISGEFPDIPFYVAAYGINTPLSHRNTHQLWEILVWHTTGGVFFTLREAATATRKHFFPETEAICTVPNIFAETLCEQTVQLWGAPPDKVYNTRCGLLIDRVLPAAFEWLKQWLPTSSDSSYLEHEYRELTRAICEELDNLAKRLTHCPPMDAYKTRFSDEEYQKQVTEKTQKGKERATAVLDVLEQEFAYIHLRYKVVIQ